MLRGGPPPAMFPLRRYFARYDGYLPLSGGQRSGRKFNVNYKLCVAVLLVAGLVITSIVFNIIHIVRAAKTETRPLDNFQNL